MSPLRRGLALLLAGVFAGNAAAQVPRSVRGTVLDASGRALAGAEVRLVGYSEAGIEVLARGASQEEGRFEIALAPLRPGIVSEPEIATLEVRAAGHARLWLREVRVPLAGARGVGWLRLPRAIPVRGRVVDAEGAPIAGASIALAPRFEWRAGEAVDLGETLLATDADGAFAIGDLGAGAYVVLATAPGFERRAVSFALDTDTATAPLLLALPRRKATEAVVVDADEREIAGAEIRVVHRSLLPGDSEDLRRRWLGAPGVSDAAGRVLRHDLVPGDWIAARSPGMDVTCVQVGDGSTDPVPLRLVLDPAPELVIRFARQEGVDPPVPVAIRAYVLDTDWHTRWIEIGADGIDAGEPWVWKVGGLPSEPSRVNLRGVGRAWPWVPLSVQAVRERSGAERRACVVEATNAGEVLADPPGEARSPDSGVPPVSDVTVQMQENPLDCGLGRGSELGPPLTPASIVDLEHPRLVLDRIDEDSRERSRIWGARLARVSTDGSSVERSMFLLSPGPDLLQVAVGHSLARGSSISGRVRIDGAAPRDPLLVAAWQEPGPVADARWIYTAPDGSFTIQGLLPGPYFVAPFRDQIHGHGILSPWNALIGQRRTTPARIEVELVDGATVDVTLDLRGR